MGQPLPLTNKRRVNKFLNDMGKRFQADWKNFENPELQILLVDYDKIDDELSGKIKSKLKWKSYKQFSKIKDTSQLSDKELQAYEMARSLKKIHMNNGRNTEALFSEIPRNKQSNINFIFSIVKCVTEGVLTTYMLMEYSDTSFEAARGVGLVVGTYSLLTQLYVEKIVKAISYKNFGLSNVPSQPIHFLGKMFLRTILYLSVLRASMIYFGVISSVNIFAAAEIAKFTTNTLKSGLKSLPSKVGYTRAIKSLNANNKNLSPMDIYNRNKIYIISLISGLAFTAGDILLQIDELKGGITIIGLGLSGYILWFLKDPDLYEHRNAMRDFFDATVYNFKHVRQDIVKYILKVHSLEKRWLRIFRDLIIATAASSFVSAAPIHDKVSKFEELYRFIPKHTTFAPMLSNSYSCQSYFSK